MLHHLLKSIRIEGILSLRYRHNMVMILPKEIETSLPFRPKERTTHYIQAAYQQYRLPHSDDPNNIEHEISEASIILTDQRLILFGGGSERRMLRKRDVPYSILESIDYDNFVGTWLFRERLLRGVAIKINHNGGQSLIQLKKITALDDSSRPMIEYKPEQLIEILNENIKEKHKQDEMRQSNVQLVLDFSFLKSSMEKGGVIISQIKCPSCGSAITLPTSGVSGKCAYCGMEYYAQDVFEKIKDLIK